MATYRLALGFFLAVAAFVPPLTLAQVSSESKWQVSDGGKMSFEVASIRLSKPGTSIPANISMETDDYYVPTGGVFRADRTLLTYIDFAYKLHPTAEQKDMIFGHLPRWVATQNFAIFARASSNVTKKDQMRLMMQSLLADRFGLRAHFEPRSLPVFALELDKPGKVGPNLRPHALGVSCDVPTSRDGLAPPTGAAVPENGSRDFPFRCGQYNLIPEPNHLLLEGSRDVSISTIGTWIAVAPPGNLGRPVVDQTGLTGTFDFTLEWQWVPDAEASLIGETEVQGPTVEEAVKRQLGLRMKRTHASVLMLVVDHVEMPSDN